MRAPVDEPVAGEPRAIATEVAPVPPYPLLLLNLMVCLRCVNNEADLQWSRSDVKNV